VSENLVQSGKEDVKYCLNCKLFYDKEELLEEVNFVGFKDGVQIDEGYTWNNEYSCKDWHLYKVFALECKKCNAVYFQTNRRFG
jgi:hypothetical protein